ncbi:MAG TPA: nitroreductase family protein [Tepidiformaceae bacterium]|nr:nitroreductase family protein [Tepidiformaceae bacterium]
MDLLDGILTLRAIRRFTDEPVSEEEILTCLRAAQQAPSGGNIQPWQFLVITDPEKKKAFGAIYERAFFRYDAAMERVRPAPRDAKAAALQERILEASRHLARHISEAPGLVAFLMPNIDMTVHDSDGAMDIGTPYASAYPAVQNFMLAARALGIGTTLTTVYRIHQQEVRDLFEIPDRYEIIAVVPMGRPQGRFGVAPRRPVEQVTNWNRFGERRL